MNERKKIKLELCKQVEDSSEKLAESVTILTNHVAKIRMDANGSLTDEDRERLTELQSVLGKIYIPLADIDLALANVAHLIIFK